LYECFRGVNVADQDGVRVKDSSIEIRIRKFGCVDVPMAFVLMTRAELVFKKAALGLGILEFGLCGVLPVLMLLTKVAFVSKMAMRRSSLLASSSAAGKNIGSTQSALDDRPGSSIYEAV
jgi:hypothetical protein